MTPGFIINPSMMKDNVHPSKTILLIVQVPVSFFIITDTQWKVNIFLS